MKNFYMQTNTQKAGQSGCLTFVKPANLCLIRDERSSTTNIFLNQNIGKGPPGRARSPGISLDDANNSISIKYKFQSINNKNNQSHNQKFTIMKKQIFILVLFVIATFASVKQSYGQNVVCPVPQAFTDPTCLAADALHPIPGTPYMYEITVPNIATGTGEYLWYVTQDKNFITAGALQNSTADTDPGTWIADIGTNGGTYNSTTGSTNELEIIWNSFTHDPANPVFVVIQVKGTDAADCPVNNLKVYQIEPVNAFTLDIASVDADVPASPVVEPYGTAAETCMPNIVSATYNVAEESVDYDYGVSYIYYAVTAANFSDSYRLDMQLSGVNALQSITSIDWAYNSGAFTGLSWTNLGAPTGGTGTVADPYTQSATIEAQAANNTVGAGGECIVIRVTVDHTSASGTFEGVAAQTISLAVDGETLLSETTPLGDKHHEDCSIDAFANDIAAYIINPRPDIQAVDPTPFLPVANPE